MTSFHTRFDYLPLYKPELHQLSSKKRLKISAANHFASCGFISYNNYWHLPLEAIETIGMDKKPPSPLLAFIGYRKPAIEAAQRLGYSCIVWSNKPLPAQHPHNIVSTHIAPFSTELDTPTKQFFDKYQIATIIGLTEKSVVPAALVKHHLKQPSDLMMARACHDKWLMKLHAQQHQIPVTPFEIILENTDLNALARKLKFPMFVKLRNSSGSRGQLIAEDIEALKQCAKPNRLAERTIKGKEMSAEVFVQNGEIVFLNQTEYFLHHHINIVPASPVAMRSKTDTIPGNAANPILSIVKQIVTAYKIHEGMLHIELFKTRKGYLMGEFALRPPGGYIMNLIKMSYGFEPWEALIKIHLRQKTSFPTHADHYSAVYLLHPGEGQISEILNADLIEKLPSFSSLALKKKAGDKIKKRLGSGEDIGTIFFQHQKPNQIKKDLNFTLKNFIFKIQN